MMLIQSETIRLGIYNFIPYGSRTRGTSIKCSDLDVLLICENDLFEKGETFLSKYIHAECVEESLRLYFKDKLKIDVSKIDVTPCRWYDSVETPLGIFDRYQIYSSHTTRLLLTVPEYVNRYVSMIDSQSNGVFSKVTRMVKYLVHYLLRGSISSTHIESFIIRLIYSFRKKDDAFSFYQKILL